jgi:hypothetical protein
MTTLAALRLNTSAFTNLVLFARRDRKHVETHMDPAAIATDHFFPCGV